MNTRNLLALASCAATVAAPSLSHAHFLWASVDPVKKTLAVGLQEVPTDEPLPLGDRSKLVKAWTSSTKDLPLKADANWLRASVADDCAGASLDYGVLDKRDAGRGLFWLSYYAKAAATISDSQTKLGLPIELSLSQGEEGKTVLTVFKLGQPAPGSDVVVQLPEEKGTFEAKTGNDGTVTLPVSAGPIAIRALVTDNAAGNHDGKAYDLVRSYSTLTIGSQVAAVASKPLTRLLHEAFGNNHDVVSHTAFIETLMSGKLTKPQLEAHFQQRALIHEAVDAVLRSAAPSQPVPYSDDQKNVLPLLRHDLESMGSTWPVESAAWPLTKGLLTEIKESAKKGPYFALGVLHVYYGGITHGGRDVGAMIASILKISPSYYLKSDGYEPYVRGVNAITDPAAQQEMIRGGKAAYAYIIAVNDSEVFKDASGKS